jgi:heptosyltransferase III
MEHREKILAIKFKYLGDVALAVPSLRAIRKSFPQSELHVLVAEEAVPLLERIPWLTRVWGFPRRRGRASLKESWPVLSRLRRERFDRSVDFTGNDRGALVSLISGARRRLGVVAPLGFWGRRYCYSERIQEASLDLHESLRDLHVLSAWGIAPPERLEGEIHTDPARDREAEALIPSEAILCHISTSQPKKEWPLSHWSELLRIISGAESRPVVFSSGPSPREQKLLQDLRPHIPQAIVLPPMNDLRIFLSVLKRASLVVCPDTGPLHFAAGLGTPTVSIFGPSRRIQFAPLGERNQVLQGPNCRCSCDAQVCTSIPSCISGVPPEKVWEAMQHAFHNQAASR